MILSKKINGIAQYIIKNNDSNRNILFIHGYTGSFLSRENIFKHFSDYNWYGIDLPNHGKSDIFEEEKLKVDFFSNLVIDFINTQKLDNLIIIGHSMGGAIAAIVASQLEEKVKLLILEGPANISVLENGEIISKLISDNVDDLKIAYQNMVYYYKMNPQSEKLHDLVLEEIKNRSKATEGLKIMLDEKIWEEAMLLTQNSMRKLNVKTILIFGDKDNIVPFEKSLEILKHDIKNLTIEIFHDTSHLPHIENEKKYLEVLSKYLEKN